MSAQAQSRVFDLRTAALKENSGIIGERRGLRRILDSVHAVAPTDTAVLITGETGTGKELIARAIHRHSLRSRGPFLKVNCAAIPAGLLENEFFGHERGAFTGAFTQTDGRFQLANQGTIFLDEIGDLPLELQPKLLRVSQEQEFERLGGSRTIQVNVRIVAATNVDLADMVKERRFRADLFYRLNVFPIALPPLREHSEDIPELVWHFVQMFAGRMNKVIDVISDDIMEIVRTYNWPGNVRELQNFLERAVIMSPGPVLRPPIGDLELLGQHQGTVFQSHASRRRNAIIFWKRFGRSAGLWEGAMARLPGSACRGQPCFIACVSSALSCCGQQTNRLERKAPAFEWRQVNSWPSQLHRCGKAGETHPRRPICRTLVARSECWNVLRAAPRSGRQCPRPRTKNRSLRETPKLSPAPERPSSRHGGFTRPDSPRIRNPMKSSGLSRSVQGCAASAGRVQCEYCLR